MQLHPEQSPDESIRAGQGALVNTNRITFSDRTISILALILAAMAIGALLMMPVFITAKVDAGKAQAEATAHVARTNALTALDKVEDLRVKLAEKGIKVQALDGH